jgi:sulfide:quinone oxidoreductase
MTDIIVLGAGIGGMPMAFEARQKLGDGAKITVVSNCDYFQFVPSNPWVALGSRKAEQVKIALPGLLAKFDIGFNSKGARHVLPDENCIELQDGSKLSYDYLVIATGPELAFDEIDGLGPERNSISVCHVDHAVAAEVKWREFCKNPGPIVVGAVQGASCFGPAYEMALLMDSDLRKRKIRDKVPMTYVTPEPYIGHLGLGGVGDTKGLLESKLRERDIKWIVNAKIDKVEAEAVHVTEVAEDGAAKRSFELPSRYSVFIPAFRGIPALMGADGKGLPGLANPRGFVLVDKYQRNPTYKNIFSVGVCVAIPPVEKTPVPVGVPKTGYMIETMVTAATLNIKDMMEGREPGNEPSLSAVCLADFGDSGVAFVAQPQIPPRNVNWSSEGYWVHMAKVAFEKYFMNKVQQGSSEPGYERLVMKLLGIEKLRPK